MRLVLSFLLFIPLLAACATADNDAALNRATGSHVMLATHDYDGTVKWYQHTLGFQPVYEWRVPQLRNAQLIYLQKNGFMIEIIGSKMLPKNPLHSKPRPGYGHFGLLVDDVDAAFAEATAKGAKVVERPRPSVTGQYRVAFIADNNGNMIELADGPRIK